MPMKGPALVAALYWAASSAAGASDAVSPVVDTRPPSLQGTVLDPEHRPVAAARAALTVGGVRLVASTDASGRYAFRPLDTGEARLTIEAPGFPPVALTVVVGADVELPPVVLA